MEPGYRISRFARPLRELLLQSLHQLHSETSAIAHVCSRRLQTQIIGCSKKVPTQKTETLFGSLFNFRILSSNLLKYHIHIINSRLTKEQLNTRNFSKCSRRNFVYPSFSTITKADILYEIVTSSLYLCFF